MLFRSLAPGAVDLWLADLDDAAGERLERLLRADERERAARILAPPTRRRWVTARGLLRRLLGEYLAADPRALELTTGAHGKPALARTQLEFNLSHSGSLALYAFARANPVGVDIELADRRNIGAIAERLGAGAAGLVGVSREQQQRELLRSWVRREALAKCSGLGIRRSCAQSAPAAWVKQLELGDTAVGALAARQEPLELRCRRLRV